MEKPLKPPKPTSHEWRTSTGTQTHSRSRSQLAEAASPPGARSGTEGKWKARVGLCLVPLVFSRNSLLYTLLCILLRLLKGGCPRSETLLKQDYPLLCFSFPVALKMNLSSLDWELLRVYPETKVISV